MPGMAALWSSEERRVGVPRRHRGGVVIWVVGLAVGILFGAAIGLGIAA